MSFIEEKNPFAKLLAERKKFEKEWLLKCYQESAGNISYLASELRLSRGTVYKLLKDTFGYGYKKEILRFGCEKIKYEENNFSL